MLRALAKLDVSSIVFDRTYRTLTVGYDDSALTPSRLRKTIDTALGVAAPRFPGSAYSGFLIRHAPLVLRFLLGVFVYA